MARAEPRPALFCVSTGSRRTAITLKGLKESVRVRYDRALHKSESVLHMLYCGAVFVEGHGMYAMAGGALGVVCLILFIVDMGHA